MIEGQEHSTKHESIQTQMMKTNYLRDRREVQEANSPDTSSRSDSPQPDTKVVWGGDGIEMDTQEKSESRTSRCTKIEPVLHMLQYVCLKQMFQFLRYAGAYGHYMPSCWQSDHKAKIWLKYAAVTVCTIQGYGRAHENNAQLPRKRTQKQ